MEINFFKTTGFYYNIFSSIPHKNYMIGMRKLHIFYIFLFQDKKKCKL